MKIKAKFKGGTLRCPKIGRVVQVNEENLPTLLAYGHDYLVEYEKPKAGKQKAQKAKADKKIKDEVTSKQSSSKHTDTNTKGKAGA